MKIKYDNVCYALLALLLVICIIYDIYNMISDVSINIMTLTYDMVYLVALKCISDYLKGEMKK